MSSVWLQQFLGTFPFSVSVWGMKTRTLQMASGIDGWLFRLVGASLPRLIVTHPQTASPAISTRQRAHVSEDGPFDTSDDSVLCTRSRLKFVCGKCRFFKDLVFALWTPRTWGAQIQDLEIVSMYRSPSEARRNFRTNSL